MPASSRLLPPNSRLAKLAQSAIRDLKFTNHLPPHQYEHHCLMSQSYEPASWDVGAGLGERRASSTTAEAQPLEFERGTQPRRLMPLLLFLLTCYTTYQVGEHEFKNGIVYAAALLGILGAHEMGHWLQALRYRVPASLPYFVPMPFGPIGTMGAVIAMRGNMGNRRSLFDIGISGPLAGLGPAIDLFDRRAALVEGRSGRAASDGDDHWRALLFRWLEAWVIGSAQPGTAIDLHPIAYAGWVGIFITALNLFPIGQLDGGHVLYALLLRRAHFVATLLLVGAFVTVVLYGQMGWLPMIVLLLLIGPNHPPTADDQIPLGTGRTILGWLTLAFVLIGFTPFPFYQG